MLVGVMKKYILRFVSVERVKFKVRVIFFLFKSYWYKRRRRIKSYECMYWIVVFGSYMLFCLKV